MPSTRLETRTGWIAGRHAELIAAVQHAIVEGLRIPDRDRDIRILEYPLDAFAPPPGRGPQYTVIEISMFSGRSIEAKRRLYAALSRELEPFGLGERDVRVIIHDLPRENWAIGCVALTDVELGFKVDV